MTALKNEFELNTYLNFVLKEIRGVQIYLNAAVIGFIICFFTNHYSLVPFIVPLFVQVVARSNLTYRQRHLSALVELPAQADAPVFIMDLKGNILLSVGKTHRLFRKHGITNIKDFLSQDALTGILEIAQANQDTETHSQYIEALSDISMTWFKIKATRGKGERSGDILVWCQDISLRKTYDFRLQDLLRYSGALLHDLGDLVASGEEFEHLSSFLLKDYEGVFITRADKGKNLVGKVFKQSKGRIDTSATIVIHNDSQAPINISRKKAQIISDDMDGYGSQEAFLEKNPLDPRVIEFMGRPIMNFITYNEADLSIIAFNYKAKITSYEKRFFEILVNNYRTMIIMMDLERRQKDKTGPGA